jgi:hypothetical protein
MVGMRGIWRRPLSFLQIENVEVTEKPGTPDAFCAVEP